MAWTAVPYRKSVPVRIFGTWYGFLVRDFLVRIFGPDFWSGFFFGTVLGTEFGLDSNLVRYLVRISVRKNPIRNGF